jgi:putative MATE family efflux protein
MPRDREVLALALPALGALIAEPLYVLGDTAIVGHLGTTQLAGLALGGLLLGQVLAFCTFLQYGTTAKVARLFGADQREAALEVGVQATWLALGLGLVLVVAIEVAAGPALTWMAGGETGARDQGLEWMRVAALGSPFVLLTAAAQGWMRGFQDTTTPLIVLAAANAFSIGLSALLVFGAGLGIRGSAIANVTAQVVSGLVLVAMLLRRHPPSLRPAWDAIRPQLSTARDLLVRTGAFFVAFTVAAAVAARMGDPQLGAHQIGMQLWIFAALFLDATAIAAQALVGRLLGAGAADLAAALARRLLIAGTALGFAFAFVLAVGHDAIPRLFTSDQAVLDQAAVLWPFLTAMMPLNGLLFALDGVLFGAGDMRFMRNVTIAGALLGYLPMTLATLELDLGLAGLWAGLSLFILIRLGVGLMRWRGRRWLVAGVRMVDEMI